MALLTSDTLPETALDTSGRPSSRPLLAPHPDTFSRDPQFWHFVCPSSALRAGATRAVEVGGERLVVFRGAGGKPSAIAARCPHLGSDLGGGRVVGDTIECPYHRFRFDGDGRCAQHDLSTRAYPTEERLGAIFAFSGPRPLFPLPAFDATELASARPLRWRLETPWFMVGANAFDARHFHAAHGRRLLTPPTLSRPNPLAMGVHYAYEIEGAAWIDRLVRAISGERVEFDVTSWCGNVLLVRARFRHDVSYGFVVVQPQFGRTWSTEVTVIVSARRSRGLCAPLVDRLRPLAKRFAVRRMLIDDFNSLRRLDYVHDGLRGGDEVLARYLRWVRTAARGADEIID